MNFPVSAFLISEKEFLELQNGGALKVASVSNDAMALFLNNDLNSDLEVGLYLSDNVISGLTEDKVSANLAAIEEVSHVIYTCFKAALGIQVSPLELETQAEIDKYAVMTRRYLQKEENVARLPEYLFDCLRLYPGLNPIQYRRYKEAMNTAYFFIKGRVHNDVLEKRYIRVLKTLRQIYRLSGEKKSAVLKGGKI
jgi:hypothetical protein